MCPHARKTTTRIPAQEERNLFLENITIKEQAHGGHKCSLKVKIARGHWKSRSKKQSQALKKTTYPNHGYEKKRIPSHLELKQGSGKDQPKATKKGEASEKDKAMKILMDQPWQRVASQRITQSFSSNPEISFPTFGEEDGAEAPMVIEAEIGGHFIHRIYVDGGSASEILYEHCFNRLRSKVKSQMVPATAPLIGFSEEIIWPMG
ncbi:hypothetical protein Tco_0760806 [Tanacetum coccineum]